MMLQHGLIIFRAACEPGNAGAFARARRIIVFQKVQHIGIGSDSALRCGKAIAPNGLRLPGRHIAGKRFERRKEIALFRRWHNLFSDLLHDGAQRIGMGHPARLDAALHICFILCEIARNIIQAGCPCGSVLNRSELGLHGSKDGLGLKPPVSGKGNAGCIKFIGINMGLQKAH